MKLFRNKRPIEDFIPHILLNTAGTEESGALPKEAAISFIRNAAILFADNTGLLTEKIHIDLQCGLQDYLIETSDCETVIGIKKAKYENFSSENCGCSWTWGNVDFTFNDDMLNICPAPNKDVENGLELELVLTPKRDACELDEQFYNKWFDAILNGALAEIHAMPDLPWSSVTRADYRNRKFHEEIGRYTVRKVLEGRREPLYLRPNPNFIIGRSQRQW